MCSSGAMPVNTPPPKSPANQRNANAARPAPMTRPHTLPINPKSAASASTKRKRSLAVRPKTPSKANCGVRWATVSEKMENTKKAPVNKATRANTLRLTR